MELGTEILVKLLENENVTVTLHMPPNELKKLFVDTCYIALNQIRDIIANSALDDFTCIERIVCVFEKLGSDGGDRHDY